MSCAECTRLGRPCVTSSIDRLDKVVDDLSAKIKTDEAGVEEALNKIVTLSSQIESLRQRIARNKVVSDQNSKRLDEQLRHVADTSSLNGLNEGFSDAATLGSQLRQAGLEDPFDCVDEIIDVQPRLDNQPGYDSSKRMEGKFREMWLKVQYSLDIAA